MLSTCQDPNTIDPVQFEIHNNIPVSAGVKRIIQNMADDLPMHS